MAHTAADGSKWSNASQARKVPGRSIGDGKQPVKSFSKPEAPRASTASESSTVSHTGHQSPATTDGSQSTDQTTPQVAVSQEGNMFVVTAKFASADEAHAAAQALDQSQSMPDTGMNPAQAMM